LLSVLLDRLCLAPSLIWSPRDLSMLGMSQGVTTSNLPPMSARLTERVLLNWSGGVSSLMIHLLTQQSSNGCAMQLETSLRDFFLRDGQIGGFYVSNLRSDPADFLICRKQLFYGYHAFAWNQARPVRSGDILSAEQNRRSSRR
jgi:hypothetical protein